MPLSISLVLCLSIGLGLGAWWRVPSLGARLMLGVMTIPVVLLLGNMALGLGLRALAWGLAAAALAGLIRLKPKPALLAHPAVLLPLGVAVLAALGGDFDYQSESWDEYSAWLTWPREAFLDDGFLSPDSSWTSMGYTQGLPALMAFPNLFFERFIVGRSLAPFVVLHGALMGLAWEMLTGSLAGRRVGPVAAGLCGWVVVLALLGLEAAWTLVPRLMLVEKPQIYLIAAVMLLLVRAGRGLEGGWLAAGVLAGTSYLIKATGAALAPALAAGLVAAMIADPRLRRPGPVLALLAPLVLAVVAWRGLVPAVGAGNCASNPFAALGDWDILHQAAETAARMLAGMAEYVRVFKLPLSGAALLGLVLACRDRAARPMLMVLVVWLAAYGAGLLVTYAFCFTEFERGQMASLPRYTRVGLRVVHMTGMVLLAEMALVALAAKGMLRPRLLGLAVAVLALQQVRATGASLDAVQHRERENPATAALVRQVNGEAEALVRHLAGVTKQPPSVYLFTQRRQGFEWVIAHQAGLGLTRPGHWRYRLMPGFSWAETSVDPWTWYAPDSQLRPLFAKADALWPMEVDPWLIGLLRPLVADPACLADLSGYFLLRNGSGGFDCVAKDGVQAVRP